MNVRLLHLAVLLFACAGPDTAADQAAVPQWDVSQVIGLGVADGDPAQEFGNIMGVAKLHDGRVAVADYMNTEVRLFSAEGDYIRSFGRQGRGPGELPALTRLARLPGDTLVVGGSTRISWFTGDGEHIDDLDLPWPGVASVSWRMEAAWPLDHTRFLLKLIAPSVSPSEAGVLRRPRELYIVAGPDGTVLDTLGEYGGLEQLEYEDAGRTYTAIPLFAPSTRPAIAHDYLALGDLGSDSVLVYSTSTRERRWLKVPIDRPSVSESDIRAAREAKCRAADSPQRCARDFLQLPDVEKLRAFDDIAVDSAGAVWLKVPAAVADSVARWIVVNTTGTLIGSVELPSNARIAQVGDTYLMTVTRDSLGLQRVIEFALQK